MNWKQSFTLGLLAPGVWDGEIEEWETLWAGTLTTTYDGFANGAKAGLGTTIDGWNGEDLLRLVVDGVAVVVGGTIYDSLVNPENALIGNSWLRKMKANTGAVDEGGDYFFDLYRTEFNSQFYSRNPGTYAVRLERKVS